jgi:hypothetical protein
LNQVVKHGHKYLTPEEQAQQIRRRLWEYWHYLGRQVFRCRDAQFWNYHRGKLREAGYPLRPWHVAFGVGRVLADVLLNPKSTVEKTLTLIASTR